MRFCVGVLCWRFVCCYCVKLGSSPVVSMGLLVVVPGWLSHARKDSIHLHTVVSLTFQRSAALLWCCAVVLLCPALPCAVLCCAVPCCPLPCPALRCAALCCSDGVLLCVWCAGTLGVACRWMVADSPRRRHHQAAAEGTESTRRSEKGPCVRGRQVRPGLWPCLALPCISSCWLLSAW